VLSDLQSIKEKKKEEKLEEGVITQKQEQEQYQQRQNPINSFLYALKSSEAQRQYPRRLKLFFDYLDLHGPLERQAQDVL
jgi:hypothetical protein